MLQPFLSRFQNQRSDLFLNQLLISTTDNALSLSVTYSLTFLDVKSTHLSLMWSSVVLSLTCPASLYSLYFRSQFPSPNNTCVFFVNSLFDFLGSEIQVSAADPLNLEPVLEVVVSTAAKLHLQTINCFLLEAAARDVCILVEPDAIPQAHLTATKEVCKMF